MKHECNTKRVKKVKHKEKVKSERNRDILKLRNTKKVQNEKKCSTKKTSVKEIAKHEKSAIRKSATWRERNMKKVQHEKSAKEDCTIVHKRITGRPLHWYSPSIKPTLTR